MDADKENEVKTYKVTLTGETPLLMHQDNIAWRETVKAWQVDPMNKGKSVAGDDRSPSWTWLGYLYAEMGRVVIPSDNLMTCIREGGTKVRTGKSTETYKKQMAGLVVVNEIGWPLEPEIDYNALREEVLSIGDADFIKQMEIAEKYGFELFSKPAKIAKGGKHIRVRPRFNRWSCSGTLTVLDTEKITLSLLKTIFGIAGFECGIGDWRPSSPSKPGAYGKFVATLK